MLRIWVVAVGPLRHPGLKEAAAVYVERLHQAPHVQFHLVEVRQGARGSRDAGVVVREEGRRLLSVELPAGALRVALAADGQPYDTPRFANWLAQLAVQDVPLAFYVGGAWGLSREVAERCQARLSLSPLTMAHELSRLVLLEQLYRAVAIMGGSPYPK